MKYTEEQIKKRDAEVSEIIRKAEAGEVIDSGLPKKGPGEPTEVEKMMKYIKSEPQKIKKKIDKDKQVFIKSLVWILIIDTIVSFLFQRMSSSSGLKFGHTETVELFIISFIFLFITDKLDQSDNFLDNMSETASNIMGFVFWVGFIFILYLMGVSLLAGFFGLTIAGIIYELIKRG